MSARRSHAMPTRSVATTRSPAQARRKPTTTSSASYRRAEAMSDIREIPIISRGRIIRPTEDDLAIYNARGGAQFRSPDPHRHIQDLVMGNPVLLTDLMDTPTSQIIEFLVEVGKRLRLDDNPFFQESFELGLLAGGLSEPILRSVYERLPGMFDGGYLT